MEISIKIEGGAQLLCCVEGKEKTWTFFEKKKKGGGPQKMVYAGFIIDKS